MTVIKLDPPITNKEPFYEYVIKELEKVGIILSRSYAFEGGFSHSYNLKPDLRFTGEYYLNGTYELTGLSSKVPFPHQVDWTEEEEKAIIRVVQFSKKTLERDGSIEPSPVQSL
jgi:hypothetical protein